jgi:hypothetical protein
MSSSGNGMFREEFNKVTDAFADAVSAGLNAVVNEGKPASQCEDYLKKEKISKELAIDLRKKFAEAGYTEDNWRFMVERRIFRPTRKKLEQKGYRNIRFNESLWFSGYNTPYYR